MLLYPENENTKSIVSVIDLLYYKNSPIVKSYIYKNYTIHQQYLFDTCIDILIPLSKFFGYSIRFYIGYDTNLSRIRVLESMCVNGKSAKNLLIEKYGYLVYLQIKNIINRYTKKYGMTTLRR